LNSFYQTTDILIIGGGVIGLSLAREFHKKGVRKITVLERGKTGQESSFAAAGILAPNDESEKYTVLFEICMESKRLYPYFVEQLFAETGVDVELDRSGSLYLAFSDADIAQIRRHLKWGKSVSLDVEHLSAEEVRKIEPLVSPEVREGLFFPNDWQVENRKLLIALQKYAELNRIEIVENTEVKNLIIENGKAVGAETSDEKFFAGTTVLATGAWTSLIKSGENALPLPDIKPIRGQMLSFKTEEKLFSTVIYNSRGYLVPRVDGRILIGATVEDAGFDKNLTEDGIKYLLETAFEISPHLASLEVSDKWAGLRPFTADGLPILGAFPEIENLHVATAHYRNGILLAPLTAKILAEKIVENLDSKYLETFSPKRFQIKAQRKIVHR
jgi:glycine oxidase